MRTATRGTYFRRMWRNGSDLGLPFCRGDDEQAYNRTGRAVLGLCTELERVFQFIEPREEHDSVFGPALQRLLFSACAEVETSWTGILRANGYANSDRWTTRDYVALAAAMGLTDYSVRLADVSDYPLIYPYHGWEEAKPTASLPWYAAYNSVKHDNASHAHLATLKNVMLACSAVLATAVAQFGTEHFVLNGRYAQRVLHAHGVYNPKEAETYRCMDGQAWKAIPYFQDS